MSVRIPALLLAAGALALWNNPWIALAIVIGSIPVPWIAVIMANDRPPLPKDQARRYTAGGLPSSTPRALPPSVTGAHHESETDRSGNGGERRAGLMSGSGPPEESSEGAHPGPYPTTDTATDTDESASGP